MPVFKIKKNGEWVEAAGVSGHSHSVSQIVDFPDMRVFATGEYVDGHLQDLTTIVNDLKAEVEALKTALTSE